MTAAHTRVGELGETAAVRYLENLGYRIITRNFRAPNGEIDIVAHDGDATVFVEVKSRTSPPSDRYGRASSAIDFRKREHFISAVREYQRQFPNSCRCHLAAVEVYFIRGLNISDCEIKMRKF